MVQFCFSCSKQFTSQKGLLQHLKSRPACLKDLGISPQSNWVDLLGLPTSTSPSSSLPINQYPFSVEPDPKAAAKRSVVPMWQNDGTNSSFQPTSPFKRHKGRPEATLTVPMSSQLLIEHRCGSRVIRRAINDDNIGSMLNNLCGDNVPTVTFAFTPEQIEQI